MRFYNITSFLFYWSERRQRVIVYNQERDLGQSFLVGSKISGTKRWNKASISMTEYRQISEEEAIGKLGFKFIESVVIFP